MTSRHSMQAVICTAPAQMGQDLIGVHHVPNPQAHQIAAPQPAVDRQVEHCQVADLVFVLQVESNRPDILGLQWWFFGRPACLCSRVRGFDWFPLVAVIRKTAVTRKLPDSQFTLLGQNCR